MSFIKNILFQKKFHSSWLVLLIDFLVITISLIASLLIEKPTILEVDSWKFLLIYLSTTVIVFLVSQVHNRIIRYANTEDMFRIFWAILIGNFLFTIIWSISSNTLDTAIIVEFGTVLLVNFFISSSLLVGLRLVIKGLYSYFNALDSKATRENVLIYGSGSASILIKRALELQQELPVSIKGFIDVGSDAIHKRIEQTNVYPIKAIGKLKEQFSIKKMIVTSGDFMEEGMKNAISACIALQIQIVTVQHPDEWLNGQPNIRQFKNLKIEDLLERQPIELCKQQVLKDIRGKRVLVTGAAGSIGSELVRQILNYEPEYVVLCDQAETPLHEIRLELEDRDTKMSSVLFFVADIRNKNRLQALFTLHRPQIVFHAAAYKHVPMMEDNPIEAVGTNVGGTKNLADLSLEFDVEKFVMISTDKAVKPTNVMGATKCIAEMYIQSLDLCLNNLNYLSTNQNIEIGRKTKFITTRFGNVLGSNGSVIPRFQAQIEKGGPITVTHPDITRYFMTIPEAVQLVLEAAVMGNGGEIYLFDMGKPLKICDLAVNMIKLAGLIPYHDIDIVFSGLRPGEKLHEELLNDSEKALPTHHKDIMIAKTKPQSQHVSRAVEELLYLATLNDSLEMVRKMKEMLPEFISNNSVYENLDVKEIAVTLSA